jgi:hypothetical protein
VFQEPCIDCHTPEQPAIQTVQESPELNPGDRVEGLGNFGTPTGELGTVERTNEEDAIVKWDSDGRTRLHRCINRGLRKSSTCGFQTALLRRSPDVSAWLKTMVSLRLYLSGIAPST